MTTFIVFAYLVILIVVGANPFELGAGSIFEFEVYNHEGELVSLNEYKNSTVILIVNVASNCGFTYTNYRELVQLHDKYHSKGLQILAFPSNQFGFSEPGTDAEIQVFVKNYGVNFPVFSKIDMNGANAHALYKYLKRSVGTHGYDDKLNYDFTLTTFFTMCRSG